MRHKKGKLSTLLLLGLTLTGLQAQVVIPVAGGNATGTGGSASYSSVGQIVYTTNTGTSINVYQAYAISSITTGFEVLKGISLQCSIYPNPTIDFLTLKIEGKLQTQYISSLYDMNGKLIENKKIEANRTRIDMSNLVSANYLLKVSDNNKVLKTFIIIKN